MEEHAAALRKLDEKLGEEDLYSSDPAQAAKLARERAKFAAAHAASGDAWLLATEELEAATG